MVGRGGRAGGIEAPAATPDGPCGFRVRRDDGDRPENLAQLHRRGPLPRPVVLRQGPGVVSAAVAGEVIAKVRGTAKYRVRLRIRGSKLHVSCTCPYFTPTGDPCKHIWATVLVADARNLLQAPPVRPLKLVSDLPRRSAANRAGPPGAGPGRPGGRTPRAAAGPRSGRSRKDRQTRRGAAAPWGGGGSGARARGRCPGPRPVNRNSKRLLVYILDVPATLEPEPGGHRPGPAAAPPRRRLGAAEALVARAGVAAGEVRPRGSGHPGPARIGARRPRRPNGGRRRGVAAGVDTMGTRRFVLRQQQAALVERLARTGRLRLRRTEGEDDPPTMRWDDGPPWRFTLEIRSELGGKRWAWRGSLRRSDARADRMDLAEPLVIVPGLLILGVGRAARFDDVGVMPWIVRLRHEKEIVFVEPQQDIMLGRILAEARVPPAELVDTLAARGDRHQAPALPDLADSAAELGARLRPAPGRARVRLQRGLDPGRPDHAPGGLDRARPGHPPRPQDRGPGRHLPVRAGVPRVEGPAGRSRHDGAAGQADGAGDPRPGPGGLAGRGRREADPPGRASSSSR